MIEKIREKSVIKRDGKSARNVSTLKETEDKLQNLIEEIFLIHRKIKKSTAK